MKKRFTEKQIAFALRQHEAGTPVAEIVRTMGVSEQAFYRWKRKYAGLGVAELRRLKSVEDENRQLKKLVADLSLDKHILQEVCSKKSEARAQADAGERHLPGVWCKPAASVRAFPGEPEHVPL